MMEQMKKKPSNHTHISSVPTIKKQVKPNEARSQKITNIFMTACCVAMVIGGAFIFFSIPADQPLSARLFALAPIAGCLALHFAMHKFMGKTCHGKSDKKEE